MAIDKTINIKVNADDAIKETKELKEEVQGVDKAANESKGGFDNMASGIKGVGVAFKAAGIGLIMTAFIGVKDAIFQNQGALDAINKKIEEFRFFARRAAESLSNFKQSIADAFSSDRKNPITEFFQAGLLLQKNFGKDWMDQVEKGTLNIEKALKEMGISAKGTQMFLLHLQRENENLDFGIVGAKEYADTLVELRNEVQLAEAEQRLLQAQYEKQAEVQRQIRDDISLTFDERIAANQNLKAILEKQFKEEKALAQKKLDLAKMEMDENEGNVALQIAFTNAKTEMAELDNRITGQRSEMLVNEKALEKEKQDAINATKDADEKALKAKEDRLTLEQQALELNLEFTKDMSDKEIQQLIDTEKKKLEIQKKADEDKKKAKQAQIATVKAMELQAAKSILSSLEQIAGEGTAAAKTAALAQILINSAEGVSAAINAGAGLKWPANLGAIASGVAAVLGGIASAKAILAKVPGGGDDTQEDVVDLSPAGFVGDLVPNMESIEQPELCGATPIQAYVVENDISNAQALQEELEIQSTL